MNLIKLSECDLIYFDSNWIELEEVKLSSTELYEVELEEKTWIEFT